MVSLGFIVTYIAPLAFVLFVTMGKEAYDDYKRHLRDREANSQRYLVLTPSSTSDPEQEFLDDRCPIGYTWETRSFFEGEGCGPWSGPLSQCKFTQLNA
jgi:hypothetical protein